MPKTSSLPASTRERLILTARHLFSEHGFAGTSLADIASMEDVSKQALLHHFKTKERLYSEVLGDIARDMESSLQNARDSAIPPEHRLADVFVSLVPTSESEYERLRLLLREMLDVRDRAERAGTWHLARFVTVLETMLRDCRGWRDASPAESRALLCQWFGAVLYTMAARETHRGIHGRQAEATAWTAVPERLRMTILSVIAAGPQMGPS